MEVPGIELRTSHKLGTCPATELSPALLMFWLIQRNWFALLGLYVNFLLT